MSIFDDLECGSCPFWNPDSHPRHEAEQGECRASPPLGRHEETYVGAPTFPGYFPTVSVDDWCGRHPALKDAPSATWADDENGGHYSWTDSAIAG